MTQQNPLSLGWLTVFPDDFFLNLAVLLPAFHGTGRAGRGYRGCRGCRRRHGQRLGIRRQRRGGRCPWCGLRRQHWGSRGAISGAVADSNEKKAQQAAGLEALRKKLGDDAFQGLAALAECKHEITQGYGRTAAASDNPDYALAGLWLQVLAYADSGNVDQARNMFDQLMAQDRDIASASQAESEMQAALKELMEIRKEYNLPVQCS
jgi:hypothetical protein